MTDETRTPMTYERWGDGDGWELAVSDNVIGLLFDDFGDEEKVAGLVRAANSHQALVEALEDGIAKAQRFIDKVEGGRARSVETYADLSAFVSEARAALEQARG